MKILGLIIFWTAINTKLRRTIAASNSTRNEKFYLFNIVKFSNSECQGLMEDEIGMCYEKSECLSKGGKPTTTCASGFGTCCVFESSCDSPHGMLEKVQYFKSPNFPETQNMPNYCYKNIKIVGSDICQLRIDFLDFQMQGPSTTAPPFGQCLGDKMTINFANSNLGLSGGNTICGNMKGQHIYVDTSMSEGESLRLFALVGGSNFLIPDATTSTSELRRDYVWNLRIRQIECTDYSDLRAPAGCLQYFSSPMGVVESFNFASKESPYPVSLNYGICFKKIKGFCGISFEASAEDYFFGLNQNEPTGGNAVGESCYRESQSNDFVEILDGYYFDPDIQEFVRTSHICGVYKKQKLPTFLSKFSGPWMLYFKSDESLKNLGGQSDVSSPSEADTAIAAGIENGFRLLYKMIQNC